MSTPDLKKNNNRTLKLVHRLIAKTFIGDSELTVNHKDGVRDNNHYSNLEWLSMADNIIHARDCLNGGVHPRAKLTKEDVFKIRDMVDQKNIPHKDIAKKFGIHKCTVSRISTKVSWGHV